MARPAKFSVQQILDAALAVFAVDGARALNIVQIARNLGAPSGSVYHRFASRDLLVAELWLRAIERFQAGYLAHLAASDPLAGAVAAAGHVLSWSRENPVEGRLLLVYRWQDLMSERWPEAVAGRARAAATALDAGLRACASALLPGADDALLRVRFALTSIPYAAVRPSLSEGRPIPMALDAMVADTVQTLLTPAARAHR